MVNQLKRKAGALIVLLALLGMSGEAFATRIKDIAFFEGVRDNQLVGYGLVVGLDGTGDYGNSEMTVQSVVSMLSRLGIKVDESDVQTRNAAAVMVTAELPPFAQSGQELDVTVASMGNARSLEGGTLLMTPLMGPDGNVYALAQGALSLGGYKVTAGSGNRAEKNHANTGRIPAGAIVEQSPGFELDTSGSLRLVLEEPDFTTSVRVARAVSALFDPTIPTEDSVQPFTGIAEAVDSATVIIQVPQDFQNYTAQFIALIEELEVERDAIAKVIVNERTGTVVLGKEVSLSEVAVAHGSLSVEVRTSYEASQPNPFGDGDTTMVPNSDVTVEEEPAPLVHIQESATIADVVLALNALGTSSRDLIAILQAIDAAGALNAQLEIQ